MPKDPDNVTRDVFSIGAQLEKSRQRAKSRKAGINEARLTDPSGSTLTKAQRLKVSKALKARKAKAEARKAKPKKKGPSLAAQAAAGSFNARKTQTDKDVREQLAELRRAKAL
jgi:hypothetical protein